MLRYIPYIVLSLLLYLMVIYMETYQPQMLDNILIQVDVFGVTRIGEQEKSRMSRINNLTIPYEEKQVLMNRTVFMGATSGMVFLALGGPTRKVPLLTQRKEVVMCWVYFLSNDKRPTILVFQDDKLVKAFKDSALSWN